MNRLTFPDKSYREPGKVTRDTVQAMRDADGDRRVAAKALGISRETLAKRLGIIRSQRDSK